MVDERLKHLRGNGRRDFLRWSATVAACLGLERARFLDVLNDSAGTAAADTAACASTNRHVHVFDGNGGLSNWTLVFPVINVVKGTSAKASHYAINKGVDAPGYDKPFAYGPDSPWQANSKWKVSAFLAGTNESHTGTPVTASSLGQNSLVAASAAIQQANPTLLPVLTVGGIQFGAAPGAPAQANVNSAAQLVDLFNSAASRALLTAPDNGAMMESYYKAFAGLNAAAGRNTVSRQYAVGTVAAALLSKNLSTQLTPSKEDEALFGLDAQTPGSIQNMARSLIVALKAFSLNLSSMLVIRGFNDDPHGLFAGGDAMAAARGVALGKMLNGLHDFAKARQDPSCSSKSLADSMVLSVSGDTYKQPFNRDGWGDGSPNNSNLLYVMGGGWLKSGWFGDLTNTGNPAAVGWNPSTGETGGAYQGNMLGPAASAAALYAVAKGDMRRVRDFYSGPGIEGVVNLNVTG